jgi:hypothetical protein
MNENETIGSHLEQMSRSDPQVKRPLRVYNFSRMGYCTVQELIVAQTYAPQIQPDAIILGFFAANDVIPNALTQVDDKGCFAPVAEQVERFRNDLNGELGPWRHSLIGRSIFLTKPLGSRLVYRLGRQPWVLERNYEVLRQFQKFCRDQGYQFSVVFNHSNDGLASWRAVLYPSQDVHRPLNAFCETSGIRFLDMRREFLGDGDWQRFIIKGEGHCTAEGVLKTAESMYRELIRPELVGQESPGPGTQSRASMTGTAGTPL